jgi:glycosyltransferase involved in cell wall biosynthesis
VTGGKPRLAFVSPVFLFPNDAGGKIRTTNVLRGLKGGAFDVTLISPARPDQRDAWAAALAEASDRFVAWEPPTARPRWTRAFDLLGKLPVNVAADRSAPALARVRETLATRDFDLVVFDFVHAAVLRPTPLDAATVCFTHNVEAEIFARHAQQAGQALMRRVWASQHRKMLDYEREALRGFTSVIAVSERDADWFRTHYGLKRVAAIPTGVDLDFFAWHEPPDPTPEAPPTVVFTGSMDWAANVDGVRFFLDEVWPRVQSAVSAARFVIVGRNPPASLVEHARAMRGVSFTGFVDDVRPYGHAAQAFVIPLRVGGGTRIKAFEAMAMGCPVVSTSIGIEGLDVADAEHYLRRDSAADQADAVVALLQDGALRRGLSRRARQCVEHRFGHQVAAWAFEQICLDAVQAWCRTRSPA